VTALAVGSVIHSRDLARSIGADEKLDPALVDFSYEESRQHSEDSDGRRTSGATSGAG